MRILFAANTAPDPGAGGAAACDVATIDALTALGHQVDAIWEPARPRWIRHGNLHQLLELPRAYRRAIDERCRRVAYDVIQANQPHAYLAARAHQVSGRPGVIVNRSHGWEPHVREVLARWCRTLPEVGDPRPWWRRSLSWVLWQALARHNHWVVRHSDGVVVCSREDYEYVVARHGVAPERIEAVAPGVWEDFLQWPPAAMDATRARRVLYVGQFAQFKAPDVVGQVVSRVLRIDSRASMTWVCHAKDHDRVRRLIDGSLQDRVALLDWMPRPELRRVLDAHGVFLCPSYFEGFSLAFLEAMARGLCVVGTRVDGMREAIRPGENGFVFERGDVEGMAACVVRLARDVDAARAVSREARRTAHDYTWNRTARQLVGFYERLLELKRCTEMDRCRVAG